ncbi:MAG TPA: NAD-dependent epimerase/dehydratase family protein, partial [Verrucomicrobiae bacterium]|nr:NAD-dependent epimerase/dehydratase family protein [Verrucomicrobiae bacterium]
MKTQSIEHLSNDQAVPATGVTSVETPETPHETIDRLAANCVRRIVSRIHETQPKQREQMTITPGCLHLVTGGSGFLGNLIARRLLGRGDRVRILDIWKDPTLPDDIEFVNCDILNRAGVAEAMRGVDVVHHNVALVPLTKSGARFLKVNMDGSRIAAEEAG